MDNIERFRSGQRVSAVGQTLKTQAIILAGFVLLIWFLELIDWIVFRGSLDALGVKPRTIVGLRGILFMPFLHDGLGHVFANTIPFIILGWLVMMRRTKDFFFVAAVIIVVSGLGVWLFGSGSSVHIGASGLVFGFFGFLLLRAYFERSLGAIVVAVVVVFLYGGLIFGVLPLRSGISWLAHLFGFLGGALAAYLLASGKRWNSTEPA